ncbi:MAG: hypothetical protein GX685_06790 [Clostridiales bacterium]|nr:hypothetical protein [Clostridiales bacterium]
MLPERVQGKEFRGLIRTHNRHLDDYKKNNGDIPAGEYYLTAIRPYDARHSFATNTIIGSHENINVIAAIMGDDPATVMRNYVHTGSEIHRAALSKYSDSIFGFEKAELKKES